MKTRRILACILSAVLAVATIQFAPSNAYADTSTELKQKLDDAQKKLDEIYAESEKASEELNATKVDLANIQSQMDEVNAKIEANEKEIAEKQKELSGRQENLGRTVSDDYKSGGVDFISILLDSTSFEDFVSRVHYAQKVNDAKEANIKETKDLKAVLDNKKDELARNQATLQAQKDEQQALVDTKQAQSDALDSKVDEAKSYVNSLDSQVKDALEAEQAAAREAQRAAAEAAKKQRPSSGGSTHASSAARQSIVDAAWTMDGGSYVYGGYSPSSRCFDCSGFTKWCFSQIGVSLPHSANSQRGYISNPKYSMSEWDAGDLICWDGHVGIYMGGGMMIDAGTPSSGIAYRHVYSGWICAGWPA